MTPLDYFDHLGRPVRLGKQLGSGGEGAFFEVEAAVDLGAKLYHTQPSAQTEAKLRTMVGMQPAQLVRVAAWPTTTLHERPAGRTIGFLMRRVRDCKEIHLLYSPANRKT